MTRTKIMRKFSGSKGNTRRKKHSKNNKPTKQTTSPRLANTAGRSVKKKRVSFASKLVDNSDASFGSPAAKKKLLISDAAASEQTSSGADDTISTTPLKPILKSTPSKSGKSKTNLANGSGGLEKRRKNRVEQTAGSTSSENIKSTKRKRIRSENGEDSEKESGESRTSQEVRKKTKAAKFGNTENDEHNSADVAIPKKKKVRLHGDVASGKGEEAEILSRKQRKERLVQLKAKRKPYLDLAMKAKKLWEQIRSSKLRKGQDRRQLIDELYHLVEGKVLQLIYAHDTVRVIQCLMALKGNVELRTKLFDEVKGEILPMSKSKYAKFFVIKMLKYGTPAQREYVIQCFYGKIPQLMKHAIAAEVVEYAYNEYANALQRSRMISEFYSPEYALWKVEEAIALEKIFEKEPGRKGQILLSVKEHISDLSTKPVLKYSLVHRLIREFLDHCTDEDRKEVIDLLKERVVEMVHTKDGVLFAMRSVWFGTPKERKIIVRTLKGLVQKLCLEEHGHLLLLAIFDSLDDTLLVQKAVLKEIIQHLDEIIKNKHGAKVLHYLLKPRSSIHFMKEVVALLAQGDDNPNSKKDQTTRHSELLAVISPPLLQYCTDNAKELVAENPMMLLAILENAVGDRTDAYRALCNGVLAEEFIPMNIDNLHPIESPQSHFMLIKLIKNDKAVFAKGEKTFSETLLDELSPDHFLSWMSCNKGAFILLSMYETGIETVKEKVASVVNSSNGKKKLKQYTFPAAKLLSQKVV